jgi:predicted aldo/keto reductase-like oxidoreductase
VDILYLHSVVKREAVLFEPLLSALVKLKKEGKTRFIGVSTHGNEPEVIRAAVESKEHDVVLTAYNFRQPHVAEVEKAMSEAAKAGLGVVAMKTQAGVFWDRERQQQINMKAALKWVIRNEDVHTTIPGIGTFDQLEENVSVMEDLTLTEKDKEDLRLGEEMGMNGLYCEQCGTCVAQCDKNVEIPTLMRSYMYTYGYGNLAKAKEALGAVDLSSIPCDSCDNCRVKCTMGFDVKHRIEDIARIKDVPEDFLVV